MAQNGTPQAQNGTPQSKYLLAGVVNNPRASWAEYLGLQDMDEWTLDDLKETVSAFVAPAATPQAG